MACFDGCCGPRCNPRPVVSDPDDLIAELRAGRRQGGNERYGKKIKPYKIDVLLDRIAELEQREESREQKRIRTAHEVADTLGVNP